MFRTAAWTRVLIPHMGIFELVLPDLIASWIFLASVAKRTFGKRKSRGSVGPYHPLDKCPHTSQPSREVCTACCGSSPEQVCPSTHRSSAARRSQEISSLVTPGTVRTDSSSVTCVQSRGVCCSLTGASTGRRPKRHRIDSFRGPGVSSSVSSVCNRFSASAQPAAREPLVQLAGGVTPLSRVLRSPGPTRRC